MILLYGNFTCINHFIDKYGDEPIIKGCRDIWCVETRVRIYKASFIFI